MLDLINNEKVFLLVLAGIAAIGAFVSGWKGRKDALDRRRHEVPLDDHIIFKIESIEDKVDELRHILDHIHISTSVLLDRRSNRRDNE